MLQIRDNAMSVAAEWERRTIRQLPFATARALTDAAFAARNAVRGEIARVFDRPTPFTLNAFQVRPATKVNQTAAIETKEMWRGHYLSVQERGGQRPKKRVEENIEGVHRGEFSLAAVVPAAAARRDAWGNWSRGELNVILSNLGAQRDSRANTTAASAKRARRKVSYFVPDPNSTLAKHVYRRSEVAGNVTLAVVGLILQSPPQYTARFNWREIAEKAAREAYPQAFGRRLRAALETAR